MRCNEQTKHPACNFFPWDEHPYPASAAAVGTQNPQSIPCSTKAAPHEHHPAITIKVNTMSVSRINADYTSDELLGFLFLKKNASSQIKLTRLQKNLTAGETHPLGELNTKSYPG